MPCYSTTTLNVDIDKLNMSRLNPIIQALNNKYGESEAYGRINNGKLEIGGKTDYHAEQYKKALLQQYSAQVIKDASKRFGWNVKAESVTKAGLTQLTLGRR